MTLRGGQAMIESVVAMLCLCVVFFAVYECASLLTAKTVLDYAAARAARARAVGLNDFMITKTVRVATLATAGACRAPRDADGAPPGTATLASRMGSYLACEREGDARGILDFALWDPSRLGWTCSEPGGPSAALSLRVWQRRPLYGTGEAGDDAPDAFDGGRAYTLEGAAEIEGHAAFYLQ